MSLINDLRENKNNNVNLVDIISSLYPEEKTKYYDLLIRVIKNDNGGDEFLSKILTTSIEDVLIKKLGSKNEFKKFIDYNERNLITEKDLSKYKSFLEIKNQNKLADEQEELKKLESQVIKLYENDEWLVIRPLTYNSSVKYGHGAKWCTAMNSDKSYFNRYCNDGVLIYCINRKQSSKSTAAHKKIGGQLTFWTYEDTQIDSLESPLPNEVMDVIRKCVTDKTIKTNSKLKLEYDEKNRPVSSLNTKTQTFVNNGSINEETYRRALAIMNRYT